MKELSIEQKAQRYDEALERARKELQICGSSDCDAARQIFRFFPELKESEDEKTRKEIIDFATKANNGVTSILANDYNFNKWIAWLEKQGEQESDTDFSNLRTWKYIVDAVLTEKDGIGQYLDSPFTEEVAKKLQKRFGNIEQKPAWSEEDEIGLGDALWAIQQARTIAKDENDMGNIWYAENWLKSLKERYTWKPTEEQMDALDYYANSLCTYCDRQDDLRSLFNVLKKLKD